MNLRLLSISALAAHGVLAQLPPNLVHKVVEVVAAVATTDIRVQACLAAENIVDYCYTAFGGTAITRAPAASVNQCVCCLEATPLSQAFYTCATFVATELPLLTAQYTLYSDLYGICATNGALCRTSSSRLTLPTSTPTITAAPGAQTYALGCSTMAGIVSECINQGGDFTKLAPSAQASCICYQTGSGGRVAWAPNRFDGAASACASWARTGDPVTAYSLATNLMGFCSSAGNVRSLASETGNRFGGNDPTTTSATPRPTTTVTVRASTSTLAPNSGNVKTPSILLALGAVFAVFAIL